LILLYKTMWMLLWKSSRMSLQLAPKSSKFTTKPLISFWRPAYMHLSKQRIFFCY
jgi:hypothetical protein